MGGSPSQRAAIECDRHLLLFAGPGSGKTFTSILKAARVLQDPSRRLILCTFTVDAAGELGSRLEAHFQKNALPYPRDRVLICTLDSLALRHLRTFRHGVNLLPPNAQRPMLRRIADEEGLGPIDELTPFLERYQSALDRAEVEALIPRESPNAMVLIERYFERLRSAGLVDLAVVKRTCAIAMSQGEIPPFNVGRETCTDFLIDEVQDSDELQLLMALTMAKHGATTTLVGDDDQTIYAWRSACGYKGMKKFAAETGAQIVRLGENYRSHEEIVASATRLISFNNPDRVDKQQHSVKGPGGAISIHCMGDAIEQAERIAADITECIEEMGDAAAQLSCAILSRTNRTLDEAEAALSALGIPYHRPGASIWDRSEIQAYLGTLLFVIQPRQDSMATILSLLPLSGKAADSFLRQMHEHHASFLDGNIDDFSFDSAEDKRLVSNMSSSFSMWRKQLAEGWITNVIEDAADALQLWARGLSSRPTEGEEEPASMRRLRNLCGVATKALQEQTGSLLSRIRRLQSTKAKEPGPGVVRLLTMHGSKGLEFDLVYLIDCTEREQDTSLVQAADERRVMYVAMTRARKILRIYYSGKHPVFLQEAGLSHVPADNP